jgi:cold shock CspA family protein
VAAADESWKGPVAGTVKSWDDDAGWGVLSSPGVPEDLFAHFSAMESDEYVALRPGEAVEFEYIPCPWPGGQDGYAYRAERVWRTDS